MILTPQGTIPNRLYVACGAWLWLAAAAAYLVLEAMAAARFRADYRYTHHYISDLGVTAAGMFDGRWLDSPQAELMNTAFYLQGVLLLSGAALIVHGSTLPGAGWFMTLIAAEAVGIILVGTFHSGAADLQNGTIAFHLMGAVLAVGSGIAAVLVGSSLLARHFDTPRWFRPVSIGLVVLSMLSFVMLGVARLVPAQQFLPHGLLERCGVYAIFAWPVLTGGWLLSRGRLAPAPVASAFSSRADRSGVPEAQIGSTVECR